MAGPPASKPQGSAASGATGSEARKGWAGSSQAARLAWASSLLDVCMANSSAGLQLVSAIQVTSSVRETSAQSFRMWLACLRLSLKLLEVR